MKKKTLKNKKLLYHFLLFIGIKNDSCKHHKLTFNTIQLNFIT